MEEEKKGMMKDNGLTCLLMPQVKRHRIREYLLAN